MKILSAELVARVSQPEDLPRAGPPEIAFLGRSNTGKSSLLNRLVGRRRLAETSSTPGKTRQIACYRVRGPHASYLLVDLPGYGYAKVSHAERSRWKRLVEGYLEGRAPSVAAVLLQDLRRDVSEDETRLLQWLEERGIPTIVALTKVDKLAPMRRAARVRQLRADLETTAGSVVPTSAQTGEGIRELWRAIATASR